MAAFISTGRSNEQPIGSLVQAAEETLPNLAEWHKMIKALVEIVERDAVH